MKQWCLIGLSSLLFVGCSANYRMGQFTAASSNNVRNLNYEIATKTKVRTEGQTCIQNVMGFSWGDRDDRIQRAMDAAIQKGQDNAIDGDLLVNVRIEQEITSYVFYGTDCMKVAGDLVQLTKP